MALELFKKEISYLLKNKIEIENQETYASSGSN
jgi:hypothetical protein